ncbi:helix-turn-helix transcriptional regulator [Dactylosporangium sp. CA-092794]|uniref:helix-turn-helix transcriptional regulator n=1 Tax=Dactylosporangium sp. CA-092794 TaxID=3239929 RepID=UPI003D944715
MDKHELAAFLRTHRERLTPADLGLPAAGPRRTPGLRREEVAQLASISTQYYTRLEQARGPNPSRPVLAALGRALRLTDAESAHLHVLAGEPPAPPGPSSEVPQSIRTLIDRLPDTAAMVLDAKFEVLAWNPLAAALFEDFSAVPRRERNLIRRYFRHPDPAQRHYGVTSTEDFGRYAAGRLRTAAARYPDDPEIRALVRELLRHSQEFAALWPAREVPGESHLRKTIDHPEIGQIDLTCDMLMVPDRDQHMVLLTAEPGTPAHDALRLLSVVGLQRFDVPS